MRLGHIGEKSLKALVKKGLLRGARTCKLDFLNVASSERGP